MSLKHFFEAFFFEKKNNDKILRTHKNKCYSVSLFLHQSLLPLSFFHPSDHWPSLRWTVLHQIQQSGFCEQKQGKKQTKGGIMDFQSENRKLTSVRAIIILHLDPHQ